MSVCEVITGQTMDGPMPKEGGLLDLRMGTTDFDYRCQTCAGDRVSCPGMCLEALRIELCTTVCPNSGGVGWGG